MTKVTKRALISSALAIVLCVSMLIGSTYAWFTDSVTSAGNVIQSGTLDVDLVDENGNSLEGQVLEFIDQDDNNLWEPGCTYQLEPVYVVNKGNLALKYEIVINGIDGNAKLLEAIDWTITLGGTEVAMSDLNGELLAGESTGALVITGHMREDAGNEYQGLTAEGISIAVFATQYTYESDSVDNQYDDITLVNNEAELAAAVAAGGNVMLTGDIDVDANATITVAKGVETVLYLNGYSVNGVSTEINENKKIFTVKGEMTVVGNGSVTYFHAGANAEWSRLFSAFSVEGGTLTLEEGVVVINNGGSNMVYGVDVNSTGGESVLNVNGATILSTYTAVREFNNHKTAKAIVNYNSGIINGDSRDIWVHNPSANAVDANGIVNIAEGIESTMTTQAASSFYGRIYNIEYGYVMVVGQAALQTAVDNAVDGTKIVLANDIVGNVTVTQKADVKFTIDGNGHTFDGTLLVDGKSATYLTAGLTIENIEFVGATADACIQLGNGDNATRYTCNVTVDGCTFSAADKVGVKSYTGGDKNVVIKNCVATAEAHSLAQLKGVDGVIVDKCTINSIRGINLNNSDNVTISNSTIDVQKYAVRFGESPNAVVEQYEIINCTIASDNVDDDAAIVLRAGATDANLVMTGTTIDAVIDIVR